MFARWISKSGCRWLVDIKHGKPEINQCSNCEHVYKGPQKDECPNCGCKMIKHGAFNSGRYPYSQEDMAKIFLRQKEGDEMGIQDKRRPIRLNPNNPRIICELYCLGFEECPDFKDIEKIKKCGCYAVLKDRHGKEVLKVLKGETDESHSSN